MRTRDYDKTQIHAYEKPKVRLLNDILRSPVPFQDVRRDGLRALGINIYEEIPWHIPLYNGSREYLQERMDLVGADAFSANSLARSYYKFFIDPSAIEQRTYSKFFMDPLIVGQISLTPLNPNLRRSEQGHILFSSRCFDVMRDDCMVKLTKRGRWPPKREDIKEHHMCTEYSMQWNQIDTRELMHFCVMADDLVYPIDDKLFKTLDGWPKENDGLQLSYRICGSWPKVYMFNDYERS